MRGQTGLLRHSSGTGGQAAWRCGLEETDTWGVRSSHGVAVCDATGPSEGIAPSTAASNGLVQVLVNGRNPPALNLRVAFHPELFRLWRRGYLGASGFERDRPRRMGGPSGGCRRLG